MKEQRITIEIDHEGRITADAEGFSGETCMGDLERLLKELSPGIATKERKSEADSARVTTVRKQTVGKNP